MELVTVSKLNQFPIVHEVELVGQFRIIANMDNTVETEANHNRQDRVRVLDVPDRPRTGTVKSHDVGEEWDYWMW